MIKSCINNTWKSETSVLKPKRNTKTSAGRKEPRSRDDEKGVPTGHNLVQGTGTQRVQVSLSHYKADGDSSFPSNVTIYPKKDFFKGNISRAQQSGCDLEKRFLQKEKVL